MTNREILVPMVVEALKAHNGKASILEVCKYIWNHFEKQLRNADDLFFTWQYDVRWQPQY